MKFWRKSRDFLQMPRSIETGTLLVAAALLATVSLLLGWAWIKVKNIEEQADPSRRNLPYVGPDRGAVLFETGIFCSFDGRNFQRVQQLEDGTYVCFVPSSGEVQQ